MPEWTPESEEYLETYLTQVRLLAKQAGEDGEEIAAGLREHIVAKVDRDAGTIVSLEVLRHILGEVGSPEAIVESGATVARPASPAVPGPINGVPAPDRSGKFLRWTLGCAVLLFIGLVAASILSIIAAIVLPQLARSPEPERRAECQTHLKEIAIALKQWESDHPGGSTGYPKRMSDLYPKYIQDIEVFACPSSTKKDRAPEELNEWTAYEFNTEWNGNGDDPVVREKNDRIHTPSGRNVLYNDGRVEFVRVQGSVEWGPVVDSTPSNGNPPAAGISLHDTDTPIGVSRNFLTALTAKDLDRALEQVKPDQRIDFEGQLDEGLPPIPRDFELQIESVVENKSAQVQVVNSEFGLDLVYENGRWWVVR